MFSRPNNEPVKHFLIAEILSLVSAGNDVGVDVWFRQYHITSAEVLRLEWILLPLRLAEKFL